MVDYMNARGMCPDCGEFSGWADGPPHECGESLIAEKLNIVRDELVRARQKFPAFNSGHEGWAVIREELDELWAEVRSNQSTSGRSDRMHKEAVQVAAMALRFLVDMPNFKN